jgi:hypothetical protein
MPVILAEGAQPTLDKDGNMSHCTCPKCRTKYRNPLLQNNYREFDKGVELRMSRVKIEIRCVKCGLALVTVTA